MQERPELVVNLANVGELLLRHVVKKKFLLQTEERLQFVLLEQLMKWEFLVLLFTQQLIRMHFMWNLLMSQFALVKHQVVNRKFLWLFMFYDVA